MQRSRMSPVTLLALAALAACSGSDAPVAPSGSPDTPNLAVVPAQPPLYLVTFTDNVTDVRGAARAMAARGGFTLQHVREHAARGFSAVIPPAALAQLRADPRVLILEPDGPVHLELPRVSKRPPSGGGQTVSYGLTRVGGSADGTGKTAWIIDTGIDLDHPDLNTSRPCHVSFVARGKNTADDGNGHGTHVAGIIAAKNNSIGTLGVAANAYVCAVRVLDNSGSGMWSWVIDGVDYVAANGRSGEVANMSLGGSGSNTTLEKAIVDASATVKFAIAAGNDGANASGFTPARVNGANIYTISAIDSKDCMPSWSNYGNPPVDYAAPGVGIISTYKGGGTQTLSGTSMAAPHVAGILLLGGVRGDGTASCDPDGTADPIAHR